MNKELIWKEYEEEIRRYCESKFNKRSVVFDICVESIKDDLFKAVENGIDVSSPKWCLMWLARKNIKQFETRSPLIRKSTRKLSFEKIIAPPLLFDDIEIISNATINYCLPDKTPCLQGINRFTPTNDPSNKYLGKRVKLIIGSPYWDLIYKILPQKFKQIYDGFEKANFSITKYSKNEGITFTSAQRRVTGLRKTIYFLYNVLFSTDIDRDYYTLTNDCTVDVKNFVVFRNGEYYNHNISYEKWIILINLIEATKKDRFLTIDDYRNLLQITDNDDNIHISIRNTNNSINLFVGSMIIRCTKKKGYKLKNYPLHQESLFE